MEVHAILQDRAQRLLDRAYVPYSGRRAACVVLLSDGATVPGVRLENASFSLTIGPVLAAVAAAYALGRRDVRAAYVFPRPEPSETAYLTTLGLCTAERDTRLFVLPDTPLPLPEAQLPLPRDEDEQDQRRLMALAESIRERAFVPESSFAVGCMVRTRGGFLAPGVNVENADWNFVLCAERTALALARAYDAGAVTDLYLSAGPDRFCTPCGTCRQVLMELAPNAVLWMGRHGAVHGPTSPASLLPDAFVL